MNFKTYLKENRAFLITAGSIGLILGAYSGYRDTRESARVTEVFTAANRSFSIIEDTLREKGHSDLIPELLEKINA